MCTDMSVCVLLYVSSILQAFCICLYFFSSALLITFLALVKEGEEWILKHTEFNGA